MGLKSTFLIALGLLAGSSFGQITTYPYLEDFESEGTGGTTCTSVYTMVSAGWTNETTDDKDWTSDVGGTTSSTTGPSVDHNPGTSTGHYLYTESSSCYNQAAVLTSPLFDLSVVSGAEMSFWYHMYGSSMGTLTVAITDDGGTTWTDILSTTDNQDLWQQFTFNLSAYIGSTVQFRFTGLTGANFYSDMAIDDFAVIELMADDVGATSIDNPSNPVTTGTQFVQASITNFGGNTINNAQVNWSINGVAQTPVAFTGPLNSGQTSAPITLGVYNFPTGTTDICVWTTLPNGNTDPQTSNDSICEYRCTGLSGTYAIGGGTPDFNTFAEATDALMNCGVAGPVLFNVAPGTYDESVQITGPIFGVDATNTITFDGGAATTTIITHDGSNNGTIYLDGAEYVTFRNFTITSTGTTDVWGVFLTNVCQYDSVYNCIIDMPWSSGIVDVAGIMGSGDPTNDATAGEAAHYCVFDNNVITGGERGISFYGSATTTQFNTGNEFTNNTVYNNDDYGIYLYRMDTLIVSGNSIDSLQQTAADGLYLYYVSNFTIEENMVNAPDYGVYLYYGNYSIPATNPSLVANNMVRSNSDYGFYTYYSDLVNFYHNTIANFGSTTAAFYGSTLMENWDIRNNIFYSETDEAFYSTTNLATNNNTADYNVYYTDNALFTYDGGAQADLATWQTNQPTMNANSLQTDPVFVSATDLHVISLSIDDAGDNSVGISVDIDGDARPAGVNVDPGADEFSPLYFNAEMYEIISPASSNCGDAATEVIVLIRNLADTIFSCPVTVEVTGDITQTLTATYNDTLLFNEIDTLVLGTIDTYNGATVFLTAYTQLANEQDVSNDTLYSFEATFTPFEPSGFSDPSCGFDFVNLYADSTYTSQFEWFDASTGGNSVGTGTMFTIPSIQTQDTYYLEYKQAQSDTVVTTYAAGNGCGAGNMFDVVSASGSAISGLRVHSGLTAGTNVPVSVYYKTGSYAGSENNAGDWTLEGSYTVQSGGTGNPSSELVLNTPITLPAGQTMGIYIEYDAEYTNGDNIYTSTTGDITLTTGIGICTAFSGFNASRTFNGELYFDVSPCSAIRVPVQAVQTAAADVNLGEDIVDCTQNGSVVLDPGTGLSNHIWQPSGNTGSTETVTSNGQYIVTATDGNNCTNSDTVLVIFEDCASIDELGGLASLDVFPNPSNGYFTVQLSAIDGVEIKGVEILTLDGKLIASEYVDQNTSFYNNEFDLSSESRGVYFFKVITTEGSRVEKLIIE